ncbi:hypothetical protein COY07_00665 [Candidatus Peregrinibacteria bacterium CG_4_10_14_0_2_um_filter_43_11]|nr:MAG: hypothetical protein COY07_00665 [Candidatus Peregrinibacteria bacterium CG_4_10_14_0_2_um_filter_43_11]
MKKDPLILVEHILECIDLIESYSEDIKRVDFLRKTQMQDAIVRRVEIIGEAAKNFPQKIKDQYSDVFWKEMVSTRNILVHAYTDISLEVIWRIVKKELLPLKKQMLQIKSDLEKG